MSALREVSLLPKAINQTLVGQLRDLLAMAESGELQSIAYVGEKVDGDIVRGYSGLRPFTTIGVLEVLKAAIIQDFDLVEL